MRNAAEFLEKSVTARAGWIVLALFLAGCSWVGTSAPPGIEIAQEQVLLKKVLGTAADREATPVDLLAIDDEVRRFVDEHVDRNATPERKLVNLRSLLFDADHLDIQYDGSETRTALETFRSRRGNCLSMTSLFLAIARYVGLDAHYQVVAVKPNWEKTEQVMIRNDHVNAMGQFYGDRHYVVDFLPEIYIGTPDTKEISDQRARALYFNNLGAEQIVNGDIDGALRYLRTALAVDPDVSEVWNNMGAAMGRHGDRDLSEFSYLRAISLDSRNMTAMSNLARFYRADGDSARADYYRERVEHFRQGNPYYLYFAAREAFASEDYGAARNYLRRAIRLKADDPDFYTALARTYAELGSERKSEKYRVIGEELRAYIASGSSSERMEILFE